MTTAADRLPGSLHVADSQRKPNQSTSRLVVLLWALSAIAPFWLIYLAHGVAQNGTATGFIAYDLPSYVANGREVFERGNGFAFPNPYDTSPDPSPIYFYWFLWLLGLGTRSGMDPGLLFVLAGVVSGTALSVMTWRLTRQVLPQPTYHPLLFLSAMWGGGLLCAGKLVANASSGTALGSELLLFDPHEGLWFLNWGRNVIFATESTYHVMAAACWLFALSRRYWWSLLFAALLACTHPWSGLEILATVSAFHFLRLLSGARAGALAHCIASGALLAALLGYSLLFLNSFDAHFALHQAWRINWNLPTSSVLLAWSPVALLALMRCKQDWRRFGWDEAFLGVAFAVAFLLSLHDRFMPSTQPLHFTRGYVWMSLLLLGLPWLQQRLIALRGRLRPQSFWAVCVLALFAAAFDNAVFIRDRALKQFAGESGFFLTPNQRELFRQVDRAGLEGVAVFADVDLSYLSSAYTRLTPYLGHRFNTLDYLTRLDQVNRLFAGERPAAAEWDGSIEYIVAGNDEVESLAPAVRASLVAVVATEDVTLYRVTGLAQAE